MMSTFGNKNAINLVASLIPSIWSITIAELILCFISIIFNFFVTVVCFYALPISVTLRRCIAAVSLNNAVLCVMIVGRNAFFIYTVNFPEISFASDIACRFHEFPIIFTYTHVSILTVVLGFMTIFYQKLCYKKIHWSHSCTLTQTVPMIISLIITLWLTIYDEPYNPSPLEQCKIYNESKSTQKVFRFLTLLSVLHISSALFVNCSLVGAEKRCVPDIVAINVKIRDVLTYMAMFWIICFLSSGILITYKYVIGISCGTCFANLYEVAFIIMPITTTLIYPVLCLWNIYPVREASILLFPCIANIVPDLVDKAISTEIPMIIVESPSPMNKYEYSASVQSTDANTFLF